LLIESPDEDLEDENELKLKLKAKEETKDVVKYPPVKSNN
jgi:hypothetical protein